jgi:hypothetical protein
MISKGFILKFGYFLGLAFSALLLITVLMSYPTGRVLILTNVFGEMIPEIILLAGCFSILLYGLIKRVDT